MIRVYGIKNCDSVKKALRFLNDHAIAFEFIDFKSSSVTEEKIRTWTAQCPVETLLNTKGTTYKTLGLKSLSLENDAKISWMSNHNLLIKRPVIERAGTLIVGFNQSQYEGIFLS